MPFPILFARILLREAPSYTPGNLFNVVMSVLGFRDARFLDKLSPDQMRALLSHLKNVRIYVKSDPKRPRIQTIRALEPQAGLFRFLADGHETTVKVRSSLPS